MTTDAPDAGKTLIVLNPHAASGRAGRLWTEIEPLLWSQLGELVIAVTQRAADVAVHLDKAYDAGVRRVVSIGGDGTNHTLVNALAGLRDRSGAQAEPMVYGMLPIGTGRDWARGSGLPMRTLAETAAWIARATPKLVDLGRMETATGGEYFLNIASAGLSGAVTEFVNARPVRRPWTFLQGTLVTLFTHRPPAVQIALDGVDWYEGKAFLVAIANGTTFGHGMCIAPDARPTDGLFDVVLVRDAPMISILDALRRVYDGSHLTHPAVRIRRAARVTIRSAGASLGYELDGEPLRAVDSTFHVVPGALHLLA